MEFKKYSKLALFGLLTCAFLNANVNASDGSINFTGTVLDAACTVDVGASSALAVDLGSVQKSAFTAVGSTASATKFTLKVSKCPSTITKASVKFEGISYDGDESVLALTTGTGVATGIGIQLLDSASTVVPLETPSSSYTLATDVSNELDFYARYIQKAATVAAGKADAAVNFTIVYP
ncbi:MULTISPECIES: fimbrial protein [Enterobacter]|uniref:Fimbrial protein n=1 Tax=Enterobacter dykesii TaxID=2797506 RepID=A0AAU7J0I3_9ENTR|nr:MULTISPECIES: fimbrial protein [Enterobacter]KAA0525036.1 fimbrial protein [Enterobacter asburiae]KAA0531046.1 fimbrial protein [Enterobacter dykesii]MCV3773536.1 fimbrial protein [Enterobacter sp. RD4-1-1]RTN76486.1 type 1 fimbrial protein [Enterobacter asburiae]RTP74935.1 type 1 fimbrial protein [Enterobacter asburiae]